MKKAHATGIKLKIQTADYYCEVTQQVLNQITKP